MAQVYPAQGRRPLRSPRSSPALVRVAGAGESALIVAGCLLGLPAVVFPWSALRIRRSVARGEAVAARWRVGAVVSGVLLVAGVAVSTAVAVSAADVPVVPAVAWVLAGLGAVPLVAGLGIVGTARVRRAPRARPVRVVVDKRLFDDSELSRRVEGSLRQLSDLAAVYAGYQIDGAPVSERIRRIVGDLQDLLRRLESRGTAQQVRLANTQFADVLDKVVLCVSPEHLKDAIDNPHLWTDPDKRVAAVGAMLDDVSAQIVENIRQVNSRTDLNFQVALTSLTATTRDEELARLLEGGS
jgi:type II secretory pathway component PulM